MNHSITKRKGFLSRAGENPAAEQQEETEVPVVEQSSHADLHTQELLIREVWASVDPDTKKVLATKYAAKLFEMAEKSPVLADEAREAVARIARAMPVTQEIKDQIEAGMRNKVRAVVEAEVATAVQTIAQEAVASLMRRFRGY